MFSRTDLEPLDEVTQLMQTARVQSVLEMGFDLRLVKQVLETLLSDYTMPDISAEKTVDALLESRSRTANGITNNGHDECPGATRTCNVTSATRASNVTSATRASNVTSGITSNQALGPSNKAICPSNQAMGPNKAKFVFLPCGHNACCGPCSALTKCSDCSVIVTGCVKLL